MYQQRQVSFTKDLSLSGRAQLLVFDLCKQHRRQQQHRHRGRSHSRSRTKSSFQNILQSADYPAYLYLPQASIPPIQTSIRTVGRRSLARELTSEMLLQDLPPEMICLIIEFTIPEGYESLMLTCSALYKLGEFMRWQHNAWQRNYKTFQFGFSYYLGEGSSRTEHFSARTGLQLLRDIAREPVVARYIRHMNYDLAVYNHDVEDDFDEVGYHTSLLNRIKEDSDLFSHMKEMIRESPYMDDDDDSTKAFTEGIFSEDPVISHQFACAFLLTRLSNVSKISLPFWDFSSSGQVYDNADLLPRLVDKIQDRAGRLHNASLSKPLTIRQRFFTGLYRPQVSALVKLRTVELYQMRRVNLHHFQEFRRWPSLRKLKLEQTWATSFDILRLLTHTPGLTELDFELTFSDRPEQRPSELQPFWNAGAFVEAIATTVGGGLRRLALRIGRQSNVVGTSTVTFTEFKALTVLDVDLEILWDQHDPTRVIPLVKLLPPSITHVTTYWTRPNDCATSIQFQPEHVYSMYRRFVTATLEGCDAEQRASFLPKLERVELRYPESAADDEAIMEWTSMLTSLGIVCLAISDREFCNR